MTTEYKKYFNNPAKLRLYLNSSSDLYNYQMNNLMDNFYDNALNQSTEGVFKAVCLSGIKTEDAEAGSEAPEDAQIDSFGYANVILKPLSSFGNLLPDPAAYSDPNEINNVILFYKSMFYGRSDYVLDGTNMPQFGQIVNCYFEDGSIGSSKFTQLRFMESKVQEFHEKYLNLATIEGVLTAMGAFGEGNSSLLGVMNEDTRTPNENHAQLTKKGLCSNIVGTRSPSDIKYIVMHYSAGDFSKEACLSYENRATPYGYHYMIGRDGSHFDTAKPEDLVQHSKGNSRVYNKNSVGICIMNIGYDRKDYPAKPNWISGKYPNSNETAKWEPYTQASLNKAASICASLVNQYAIPVENIVGHSDIQSNKSDPGPAFDMARFRNQVARLTGA